MHAQRSTTLHVPAWDRLQVNTCIAGQHRRSQRSTAFTNARCLVRGNNGAFAAGRATPRGHIRQRVKDAETCTALPLSLQLNGAAHKHIVSVGMDLEPSLALSVRHRHSPRNDHHHQSRASIRAAREGLHLGAGVGTREPVFFGIFVFWLTAVVCKQLSPGGEIYS